MPLPKLPKVFQPALYIFLSAVRLIQHKANLPMHQDVFFTVSVIFFCFTFFIWKRIA